MSQNKIKPYAKSIKFKKMLFNCKYQKVYRILLPNKMSQPIRAPRVAMQVRVATSSSTLHAESRCHIGLISAADT